MAPSFESIPLLFDEALRDLDSLLKQAQEAAGRLAECHECDVSGKNSQVRCRKSAGFGGSAGETDSVQTVHRESTATYSGSATCSGSDATLSELAAPTHPPGEPLTAATSPVPGPGAQSEAEARTARSGIRGSRRMCIEPLQKNPGDHFSPGPMSVVPATPSYSFTSSRFPTQGSRVILFKPRKAWLELSDEELATYMPGYRPDVKLHCIDSMTRSMFIVFGAVRRSANAVKLRRPKRRKSASEATWSVLTYVVEPNKSIRLAWNIPALFSVMYDTLMVPMQAFHVEDEPTLGPILLVLEWLITMFWTIDIVVQMRTGYYEGTQLEMRPGKVFEHYLRTWFVMDFPLVILEWLSRFASALDTASVVRVARIFRIVRCVRLLRLAKLQILWSLLEDQISSSITLLTLYIAKMLLAFLVFVHGIACIWYAIGEAKRDGWTSYEGLLANGDSVTSEDGIGFWYFASCRWTLAQINGRTDMHEKRNMVERMYTCLISVLFAVLFMAVFLSSVTTTMLELGALSEERNTSKRSVNEYLDHHRLSARLAANIKRHITAKITLQALANEEARERAVLSQIPEHLQYDLLHEIRGPVLRWHCFFRDIELMSLPVMRCVCFAAMRPMLAHRCEEIFDQGNPCSRMFWLERGKCVYEQFEMMPVICTVGMEEVSATNSEGEADSMSHSVEISERMTKKQKRVSQLPVPMHDSSSSNPSRPSFAVLRRLGTMDSVAGNAEEAIWKVRPGMWLAEAALWMEWENRGQLVAEDDSCILTIEAEELALALRDHKDGYSMAALYGRSFVEELKDQEELSDLLRTVLSHEDVGETRLSFSV